MMAESLLLLTVMSILSFARSATDWSFHSHDHVLPYSTAGSGAIGYLDGSIYILGCGDDVMEYDLENDAVSTLNDTLSSSLCLNAQSSAQSGSKIYGISSTSGPWNGGLFVFDLETMSFNDSISYPFGSLESTSCVALNTVTDILYIVGGSSNPHGFYEVNLSTLQWRTGPTTNDHREHSECIVDKNGYLWAIAGRGAERGSIERYHPEHGVWETMDSLFLDQLEGAAVSLSDDSDHIVVIGGYISSLDIVYDGVVAIDIVSGSIRNINVVEKGYPVRNTAFVTVNGTVYLFGGSESTDSFQSFSLGTVHTTTSRPTTAPTATTKDRPSNSDDDSIEFTDWHIVVGAVTLGVIMMVIIARYVYKHRRRAAPMQSDGKKDALLANTMTARDEGIQTV